MIPMLLALALAADPNDTSVRRLRAEMTLDGYGGSRGTGGVEVGMGVRGEHLGFRAFVGGGATGGDGGASGGVAMTLGTGGRASRFEVDLGVGIQRFSRDEEPDDLDSAMMVLGLPVETHAVSDSTAVLPFGQVRAGGAWALGDGSAWLRLGFYVRAMNPTDKDYTDTTCVYFFWMGSCADVTRTTRYGATSVGIYASIGSSRVLSARPAR